MERFVIGTNGVQPLIIITKRFILDIAAALEPPLLKEQYPHKDVMNCLDFYMLKMFLFKIVCWDLLDHTQSTRISVFDCFDFLETDIPLWALN